MGPVVVLGGTGFLGRRIVARLRARQVPVRVATRRPPPAPGEDGLEFVAADVRHRGSLGAALAGARAAVNAVGLYRESGAATFRSVHVTGAGNVAAVVREQRVGRLVHVSGMGADGRATSPYIASRGQGEDAVRQACDAATIMRPSVLFGEGDAFVSTLADLVRRLPAIPLFGTGETRLQPVHVDDVADAIAEALTSEGSAGRVYELGGSTTYTYRGILARIAGLLGRDPVWLPVPFAVWRAAAALGKAIPGFPLTEAQVSLMMEDKVVAPDAPGLPDLGVAQRSLDVFLREALPGDGIADRR